MQRCTGCKSQNENFIGQIMNLIPYILKGDTVTVDYGNPIFAGHFPGKPMLPGVYIIQMATDWICAKTGKNLTLTAIKKCRYIKPVTPELGTDFRIEADFQNTIAESESAFEINFTLYSQEEPVTWLKARFCTL